MRLDRRLKQLEAQAPPGCGGCRDWIVTQVLTTPDDPEWGADPWTQHGGQCPACGRGPVRVIDLLGAHTPPPEPHGHA